MSSDEPTKGRVLRDNNPWMSGDPANVYLCGKAPEGYWEAIKTSGERTRDWTENRKKAANEGIAYYKCERCGRDADVCGHPCICNSLCGRPTMLPEVPLPKPEPVYQSTQPPATLLIGIPTGIANDFEWSRDFGVKFLQRMCPPNSALIMENRYGIAQARESIVNAFIKNPMVSHLLFFDSDILPVEMHGVTTLIADTLSDPKKYIVSGLYYNSLYSGLNCWKQEQALKLQDLQQYPDPVVEVDKVGMGYCVIRKDLFKVLTMEERPLFYYKIIYDNMQSEDFVFFDKLAKYGIHPYVDTRVTAQHIKRCKINVDGGIQF